jgi:hypothetical protein
MANLNRTLYLCLQKNGLAATKLPFLCDKASGKVEKCLSARVAKSKRIEQREKRV